MGNNISRIAGKRERYMGKMNSNNNNNKKQPQQSMHMPSKSKYTDIIQICNILIYIFNKQQKGESSFWVC